MNYISCEMAARVGRCKLTKTTQVYDVAWEKVSELIDAYPEEGLMELAYWMGEARRRRQRRVEAEIQAHEAMLNGRHS